MEGNCFMPKSLRPALAFAVLVVIAVVACNRAPKHPPSSGPGLRANCEHPGAASGHGRGYEKREKRSGGKGFANKYDVKYADDDGPSDQHDPICVERNVDTMHWYHSGGKNFTVSTSPLTAKADDGETCPQQAFTDLPTSPQPEVHSGITAAPTSCQYAVTFSLANEAAKDPHIIIQSYQ